MKKRKPFPKKSIKFPKKSINLTREKKREAIHSKIFIGFLIANVIHYMFFEPGIVGSDPRYAIYVFWIPVILGLIISSRYYIFWDVWKDIFKPIKGESYFKWFYSSIFILLCNCMFSYIIFGFTANVIWTYVNKNEANNHQLETFYLPVNEFSSTTGKGSSNKIYFNFKGNSESINTSYKTLKPYLDLSPDDYQIKLRLRKGIWNYYIVEGFNLSKI